MKFLLHLLVVSIVLCLSGHAHAQNYQATYALGKSWQTSSLKLPSSPVSSMNDSVYCDRDTVVFGETYIAVVSENGNEPELFFREDLTTGEVFFYEPADSSEYPMMDLSAQIGDTLVSFIPWTKASSLSNGDDSLIYITDRYKIQDMLGDSLVVLEYESCNSTSFYGPFFYVEKFGSFESPLFVKYPCNLNHIANRTSHCGYENGVQFFMNWQSDSCGISTVSITEVHPDGFKIYPNPTYSFVTIEGDLTGEITLLAPDGRTLRALMKSDMAVTLDVAELPAGVYFIRLKSDNHQRTQKLIVE